MAGARSDSHEGSSRAAAATHVGTAPVAPSRSPSECRLRWRTHEVAAAADGFAHRSAFRVDRRDSAVSAGGRADGSSPATAAQCSRTREITLVSAPPER